MDRQPGVYVDAAGIYWLRKPGKWLMLVPTCLQNLRPSEPVIRLTEPKKSNGGNQTAKVSDNT